MVLIKKAVDLIWMAWLVEGDPLAKYRQCLMLRWLWDIAHFINIFPYYLLEVSGSPASDIGGRTDCADWGKQKGGVKKAIKSLW
jgi:hypothetical protein